MVGFQLELMGIGSYINTYILTNISPKVMMMYER